MTIKSQFNAGTGAQIAAEQKPIAVSFANPAVEANVRRVEQVITAIQGVQNTDIHFKTRDHKELALTTLEVNGEPYNIIIYENDAFRVLPQGIEGNRALGANLTHVRTFEDVAGSLAMIAGYHYPQYAAAFDSASDIEAGDPEVYSSGWDRNLESC